MGIMHYIDVAQKYSVPLFVGVTLGMVVANVAEEFYNDLFFTSWGFDLGGHEVDFAFIINDILMAIHFGLALQEIAVACLPGGAMSPISKAANPIIATLGGLFGPIGFFFVMSSILYANDSYGEMPPEHRPINGGTCGAIPAPPEPHRRLGGTDDAVINITDPNPEKYSYEIISMGWGIVTATDIPLAWVGAEIIFGMGHPAITYLLLLAVADDFCGVVIIAIFYPDPNHPFSGGWLLFVFGGMFTAFLFRKAEIQWWGYYAIVCGGMCWIGLLFAGVHPALALVPIVPFLPATPSTRCPPPGYGVETDRDGNTTLTYIINDEAEKSGLIEEGTPEHTPKSPMKSQQEMEDEHESVVSGTILIIKQVMGAEYKAEHNALSPENFDKVLTALEGVGVHGTKSRMTNLLIHEKHSPRVLSEKFLQVQIETLVGALKGSKLFGQMDSEHLKQLATIIMRTELTTHTDKTTIIEQGTEGDHMFIVAQGKVQIVLDDVCVDTRNAAETCSLFGDTSLIQKNCPRTASCISEGEVKVWDISFNELLKHQSIREELEIMQAAFDKAMLDEEHHRDDFHASTMHGFEHGLKRFMVFVVLFLFACANAGVTIKTTPGPLALTISASLLFGKFIGILFMANLSHYFIAPCPEGVGFKELIVIGLIAAIGMTIALFISVEAFASCPELEADAKLGSLFSVAFFPLAALVGQILKVNNGKGQGDASQDSHSAIEDALLLDAHAVAATDRAIEAAANAAHEAEIAEMTATVHRLQDQAQAMRVFIADLAARANVDIPADMMVNRVRGESIAYDKPAAAPAAASTEAPIAEEATAPSTAR